MGRLPLIRLLLYCLLFISVDCHLSDYYCIVYYSYRKHNQLSTLYIGRLPLIRLLLYCLLFISVDCHLSDYYCIVYNYTPRTTKPPEQRRCWGVYWFHSVRPSVRPAVCPSVRLSRLPCPLCNIYSCGWILSILATNDRYHKRVCRTQWPLTLTYIFKVIRPWLRKLCPFCSVYSSGWILFIFGTNDHYH